MGVTGRLEQRLAGAGFRCEMQDDIGRDLIEQVVPYCRLRHIADDQFDPAIECRRPAPARVHLRMQIVERDDPVEAFGEHTRTGTADEAGSAGDEAGASLRVLTPVQASFLDRLPG